MAGSSSDLEFRSLSKDQVGVTAGFRKGEWSEETPLSLQSDQKHSAWMECSSHRRDAITNLKTQET